MEFKWQRGKRTIDFRDLSISLVVWLHSSHSSHWIGEFSFPIYRFQPDTSRQARSLARRASRSFVHLTDSGNRAGSSGWNNNNEHLALPAADSQSFHLSSLGSTFMPNFSSAFSPLESSLSLLTIPAHDCRADSSVIKLNWRLSWVLSSELSERLKLEMAPMIAEPLRRLNETQWIWVQSESWVARNDSSDSSVRLSGRLKN